VEQEDQDLQAEVRVLQEESSRLSSLQQHAGYGYLVEIAKGQMENRLNQILLSPLKTMDEVLAQEFLKGEYAGIRLFTDMVQLRIEVLKEEIEKRMKEDEHDTEE